MSDSQEHSPSSPASRALAPTTYLSAETFRQEKRAIFEKSWRLVGHENMLAGAGAFIADEIAGAQVFVVRGEDGALRGFYNVCPHRAGPLVDTQEGACAGAIECRYHGWRFAFDGRLKSARDFGAASNFDPRDFSLRPVKLDCWRGFIFVSLDDEAAPVAALMTPVEKGWPSTDIAPFRLRRSHEIACNWKTYVENYLEGYHVPLVHPGLDAEIDSAAYRVRMEGEIAVHEAPSRDANAVYAGYWAWAWPWLGVNVYRHGVMMERMTPLGPARTRLDYLYFFNEGDDDAFEAMLTMSDEVTAEDRRICEAVARNIASGGYRPGLLSPRHENAVAWFQARCASAAGYRS